MTCADVWSPPEVPRHLAELLGVSSATVSAIETGQTALTIDRLAQIAVVMDEPISALLPDSKASTLRAGSRGETHAPRHWKDFPPLTLDPVLNSAVEAFVETGYHGASMRVIAERAAISIAGVYHHYGSKQDLLVAIFDLTMDDLDWRLPAARDWAGGRGGGPLHKLAALVEALALFHTSRPHLAFIGVSEMRSLEADHRSRIATRRSTIQRLVDEQIDAAVAEGVGSSRRPRETGRAVATMCTSLPQWFDHAGVTTAEEVASEYATIALRMIGVDGGHLADEVADRSL